MKNILWIFALFFLVGCGQSQTIQDEPGGTQGNEDPTPSCPTYEFDGQTVKEVPEEELDQYDIATEDMPGGMNLEQKKESAIQSQRVEDFRHYLEEEGMSLDKLQEYGGMLAKDTSVVVQVKEGISEEKRAAINTVVKKIRDKYNEEAIIVDEVSVSYKEKNARISKVVEDLKNHETIGEKLSSVGTCDGGSLDIQVTLLEEPEGEEVDYLRSAYDFPVYTKVFASETSGYVTAMREGRMLVDFTWFSDAPAEVEVGSYVDVIHGGVAESFPAQSSAYKTEIKAPRKPDGADRTDREAVKKALESVDNRPLNVTETSYDKEKDEWSITVTKGMLDERDEETVVVPD